MSNTRSILQSTVGSKSKENIEEKNNHDSPLPGASLKLGAPPLPVEGESLFRGAGQSPNVVFNHGFKARGKNTNLETHFFPPDGSFSGLDSAYISTSTSKEVAAEFPKPLRPGAQSTYVYELHVKQPTINVSAELMPRYTSDSPSSGHLEFDRQRALLQFEKERAVPFRIQSSEIKGAWRVDVTKAKQLTPEELKLLNFETSIHSEIRVIQNEFIPNPNYPSHVISRFWNTAKGAARAMTGIGLFIDGSSLYHEYQTSRDSGDYTNTQREGARIAGGWGGAYTAGIAGVKLGAFGCAPIAPPYGSAVCGFVGGLIGSIGGYTFGSKITTQLFDETNKCLGQTDIYSESISESLIPVTKSQQGFKNIMFRLFESSAEQDKRIEDEFKQRDAQLLANYTKEREREEARAAKIRADYVWASAPSSDSSSSAEKTASLKAKKHIKRRKSTTQQNSSLESKESKTVSLTTPTTEDKRTAEFLIDHGASTTQVVTMYQDKDTWQIAKDASLRFEENESKLGAMQNQAQCIQLFNGAGAVFNALSQCRSPELARIGRVGYPIMMGLVQIETLWGVFSGGAGTLATTGFWGSFGAVGALTAAGISLLNVLFSSDDEEQQRQLMESLQQIHQHISTIRREMHERFDRVEQAISHVASMMASYCNQIIQNQKTLFEQNRQHIELSLNGFRTITALLTDFRAENRSDHERIFSQFSYLIDLQEAEPLEKLQKSIARSIENIKEKSKMAAGSDSAERREALLKQLIDLGLELKHCATTKYNGIKEFKSLKDNPALAINFLKNRCLVHDDALGFLLAATKYITGDPLAGVQEDKLPATAVWVNTVNHYVTLSRLPVFEDYDTTGVLSEIKAQADNVQRFLTHLKTSDVVQKLLARHKNYLHDLQQALYHVFIRQQKEKPGIKDHKTDESQPRMLTVREYCFHGVARTQIEPILHQIDYIYLLLNRLVYLAGFPPAFQQEIARLDRSTTLLEQTFNFNETMVNAHAGGLIDESYSTISKYIHETPYQMSHLETIGAHLHGPADHKQLIFVGSYCASADQPGASDACSLSVNRYDVNAMSYGTNIATIRSHGGLEPQNQRSPFPMVSYKGNFKTEVNHTWASSHLVNLSGTPHICFYTGGSGYVSLFNLNTGLCELVDTSHYVDDQKKSALTFAVPVPKIHEFGRQPMLPAPDTTCYTHILNDRYIHFTKLQWQSFGYPKVDFYAIDLQEKRPLASSYEVIRLFNSWDWGVSHLRCPSQHMPISPNELFIHEIRPTGKCEALTYGFVQPTHQFRYIQRLGNDAKADDLKLDANKIAVQFKDSYLTAYWMADNRLQCKSFHESQVKDILDKLPAEHDIFSSFIPDEELATKIVLKYDCYPRQLSASFYYKPIVDKDQKPKDYTELKQSGFGIYSFPITAKKIHQTRSEVLHVDGENILLLPVTVTASNDRFKLVIISADFFKSTTQSLVEAKEFDIPTLHANSDWQAMRTAVAKIGDRDHLIITLLNPEYKMLIFSYDPKAKKLTQHVDGPQLQFVEYEKNTTNPTTRVSYAVAGRGADRYLMKTREKYPGFYPVRPIAIRVDEVNKMSTLYISYPTTVYPYDIAYQIHVAKIPLSPSLGLKKMPDVPALPAPSTTATAAPASPQAVVPANHLGIDLSRAQLLLSLSKVAPHVKNEAKLEKSTELEAAISSCQSIYELLTESVDEFKLSEQRERSIKDKLRSIAALLEKLNAPSNQKDALANINAIYKLLNTVDGLLKSNPKYAAQLGKTIDRQLDQLKEEVNDFKKPMAKSQSAKSDFLASSIFSEGANAADAIEQLMHIINKNMDIWESMRPTTPSLSQKEELTQEAKEWGLTCKDMKEDGNCLFHAIADQLQLRANNTSETHTSLRAKALAHILSHQEEYKPFIAEDFDKFISENAKNRTWADSVMISALSRELGMTIAIVRSDHAKPTIIKHPKPQSTPDKPAKEVPVLYIGFEVERHYQSLLGESATLLAKIRDAEVDNFADLPKRPMQASKLS